MEGLYSMATVCYFEETVTDQDGKSSMDIEFGRSSYYGGCKVKNGVGEDSIYINVDGNGVIMNLDTAKRFVEAVNSIGTYYGLAD